MSTRRGFLKGAGMAYAALFTLRSKAGAVIGAKKIPVGIQLYSFRKQGKDDFAGIIKKAAELGFAGVEFAGYGPYGDKPQELRKMLDDLGLKAFGTHTGFNLVQDDRIQRTIDFHRALGCPYVIIPGMGRDQLGTRDNCLRTAEFLTKACATAQASELYLGYHAHGGDFKKFEGGATPWELLYDNTPESFIHQIDLGNCLGGGGDPYAMIERYPGRSLSVHLKEHGGPKGAVFGEGEVDFKRALALCEKVGGTRCYIIEHESNPDNAFATAAQCLDYLKKLQL